MNELNVFKNPYYKWRYPSCWIKNIRMFFRSFKYAYQRITKGYANCDVWDLDSYYLTLMHDTLNYLAEHHCGYPGDKEFPEDEDWTKYLKDMAQFFYQAKESNNYYPTPEEDKWYEWVKTHGHKAENNPYIKTMMEETKINSFNRCDDMKKGFEMLQHVFFHLWD